MTVIVCGPRKGYDGIVLGRALHRLKSWGYRTVVHGDCRGVDRQAASAAVNLGLHVIGERAEWNTHGKAAGPIRNQRMLETHSPQLVLCVGGNATRGTRDMFNRAITAGVPTMVVA